MWSLIGVNCFFVTCEAIRVFKPFVLLVLKCVKCAFNTARVMKFMVLFASWYVRYSWRAPRPSLNIHVGAIMVKDSKKSTQIFTINWCFLNCFSDLLHMERCIATDTYNFVCGLNCLNCCYHSKHSWDQTSPKRQKFHTIRKGFVSEKIYWSVSCRCTNNMYFDF